MRISFSLSSMPFTDSFPPSANSLYNFLTSAILEAASNSCPSKPPREHRRRKPAEPPWWEEECKEADANRKAARRNFRRNPNLYDELLLAERFAKETFSRVKKQAFKNFCSSLSPFSKPSVFWNTIKRFRHRNLDLSNALAKISNIHELTDLIPSICPPSCFFPNFPTVF